MPHPQTCLTDAVLHALRLRFTSERARLRGRIRQIDAELRQAESELRTLRSSRTPSRAPRQRALR